MQQRDGLFDCDAARAHAQTLLDPLHLMRTAMNIELLCYSRVLVIDADDGHGDWLVQELNRPGFHTELAAGWPAARTSAPMLALEISSGG